MRSERIPAEHTPVGPAGGSSVGTAEAPLGVSSPTATGASAACGCGHIREAAAAAAASSSKACCIFCRGTRLAVYTQRCHPSPILSLREMSHHQQGDP